MQYNILFLIFLTFACIHVFVMAIKAADTAMKKWNGTEEKRPFKGVYEIKLFRKDITVTPGNILPTAEEVFLSWYKVNNYDYSLGSTDIRSNYDILHHIHLKFVKSIYIYI